MPKRANYILPKSLSFTRGGKYQVRIWSRKDQKTINTGIYNTIEEAIKGRDRWVVANYDKVEGYLPRGLTKAKASGRFTAQLSIGKGITATTVHIGTFPSIDKAMEARRNYILSLL